MDHLKYGFYQFLKYGFQKIGVSLATGKKPSTAFRTCAKTCSDIMSSLLRPIGKIPLRNGVKMNWITVNQQSRLFSSPAPKPAGNKPKIIELAANDNVWWCACGYSEDQPFCDGAHERNNTGMEPIEFIAKETKKYAFCTCKLSKKAPLCDGMFVPF